MAETNQMPAVDGKSTTPKDTPKDTPKNDSLNIAEKLNGRDKKEHDKYQKEKYRRNKASMGLDGEIKEEPIEYFYINVKVKHAKRKKKHVYHTYKIDRRAVILSKVLKTIIDEAPRRHLTPDDAVELSPIKIIDDSMLSPFYICTPELYTVIVKYLDMWKEVPRISQYVKDTSVDRGHISDILDKKDLELIKNL